MGYKEEVEKGQFRMQWRDDVFGSWSPWRSHPSSASSDSSSFSVDHVYNARNAVQGVYTVEAELYEKTLLGLERKVAEAKSKFNLTKEINGRLAVNGRRRRAGTMETPSNVQTNFTFSLHDPTDFFATSLINYFWFVDEVNYGQTKEPKFQFQFSDPGRHSLGLTVIAYQAPNGSSQVDDAVAAVAAEAAEAAEVLLQRQGGITEPPFVKFGMFRADLQSEEPISKIDTAGPKWMKQGELMNVEVSCDGSGPWNYCWSIKNSNYNVTGHESCSDPSVLGDTCSFPIVWYFRQFGSYSILVHIDNGVSQRTDLLHINVYEVHPQTPVAFFLLPLLSGLGAFIALVVGTIYIWGMRTSFIMVEVADFDFANQEDHMTEKTFLERLRDSMVTAFSSTSDTVSHVSSISARSVQPSGGGAGIHYGSIS